MPIHPSPNSKPLAPKNNAIEGKPDASLVPMDLLIKYVAPAYQEGVIKYRRDSWRDGFPVSVMIAALRRHEAAFFHQHEDYDQGTLKEYGVRKHHLGAVIFCCLSILHTLETRPELDDRHRHRQPAPDLTSDRWVEQDFVDMAAPVRVSINHDGCF